MQWNFGSSQVQIGTIGKVDSQLLNSNLQNLPWLPIVENKTSHHPINNDKTVAENNCLQSNHCIDTITGVYSANALSITVSQIGEQHQITVLNLAAPNVLSIEVDSLSNVIAAPLQFPLYLNSQYSLTSTFPVNQYVAQFSQLCNNQFVLSSQVS